MTNRTILMLCMDGRYSFYSTPTALYQHHTPEELGISRAALNNHFSRLGTTLPKSYQNDKCLIVKDEVVIKKGE